MYICENVGVSVLKPLFKTFIVLSKLVPLYKLIVNYGKLIGRSFLVDYNYLLMGVNWTVYIN